ncbi:MAG TPA: DUF2723 domain-containing protein [Candidatus Ozemobacteraceae bacterium]|nr:DUF2723 domain-containing protein [Candidatus Ozemobacteraceae bacterium]
MLNRPGLQAGAAVFIAALLLYLPTLQPGIGWYNAPELVTAALTLDVPHSPGYPLFTRLARLAIDLVPWGEPAWRVNLLSALLGALAAALWAAWLTAWGIGRRAALCAGIWLAAVPVFWEQATSSEVYTLECLLLAAFLLAANACREGPVTGWHGLMAGLTLALGVTHRPTFLLLGVSGLILLRGSCFRQRITSRGGWGLVAGGAAGALPALDLYIRLQNERRVLIDPLIGRGFDGFWRFFSGEDYRKALGVFGPEELLLRLGGWWETVIGAGIMVPIIAGAALAALFFRRPLERMGRPSLACLWIVLVNSGFVLNYNAFEAQTMLLPSLMGIAGLAAVALSIAGSRPWNGGTFVLAAITLLSVVYGATGISPRTREPEEFTRRLASVAPPGSMLLMNNDIEFRPFYYLRLVRGFRPDIGIRLVDAITDADAADLASDVSRNRMFGSLVYPPDAVDVLGKRFRVEPRGYLWHIQPQELVNTPVMPPASWTPVDAVPGIRVWCDPQIRWYPMGERSGRETLSAPGPNDVIHYRYLVEAASGSTPFILAAELTDRAGTGFQEAGGKTGHDIHRAGLVTNRLVHRTIVVPPGVEQAGLRFRISILPIDENGFPVRLLEKLPGAHPLNRDGETELFRLRHGLGGKWLVVAGPVAAFPGATATLVIDTPISTSPIIP